MSFQIEVLKVVVENKGKFRAATVDHKTSDGKVDSKKLVSFAHKEFPNTAEVFKTLSQSQQGDQYEIEAKKDTNGYWQWVSAVSVGRAGATSSPGVKVVSVGRSTYETPEERAARQIYIVRQSSITAALTLSGLRGENPGFDEIIETAKQFEAYVFSKDELEPAEVN